jgi:hypothetical protein
MGTTVADRDVVDLFAAYRPQILEMRLSDPSFAELWADYCEIFDALEPINGETTELEERRRSLEEEFTQALGARTEERGKGE